MKKAQQKEQTWVHPIYCPFPYEPYTVYLLIETKIITPSHSKENDT